MRKLPRASANGQLNPPHDVAPARVASLLAPIEKPERPCHRRQEAPGSSSSRASLVRCRHVREAQQRSWQRVRAAECKGLLSASRKRPHRWLCGASAQVRQVLTVSSGWHEARVCVHFIGRCAFDWVIMRAGGAMRQRRAILRTRDLRVPRWIANATPPRAAVERQRADIGAKRRPCTSFVVLYLGGHRSGTTSKVMNRVGLRANPAALSALLSELPYRSHPSRTRAFEPKLENSPTSRHCVSEYVGHGARNFETRTALGQTGAGGVDVSRRCRAPA